MLLGKRSRPPMKRTTSMTEFAADLAPPPPEHEMALHRAARGGGRRSSVDCAAVVETAPFLRACGLCNRRLGPGRDIFMYRGEIAFCSLECRQQQMSLDERKEKCSVSSMKKD